MFETTNQYIYILNSVTMFHSHSSPRFRNNKDQIKVIIIIISIYLIFHDFLVSLSKVRSKWIDQAIWHLKPRQHLDAI